LIRPGFAYFEENYANLKATAAIAKLWGR